VKMCDKVHKVGGSVLRVEMTMNNEKSFRVYRPKEGEKKWRRMRRGLAYLHRRGEVSQQVNERYLDALASVDDGAQLQQILEPMEKRKQWQGRPVRARHPFSPEDGALLEIISRGEFMIRGICSKDLQRARFPQPASSSKETRCRSALISHHLRRCAPTGLFTKSAAEIFMN
jgi:hypothetical protein